MSRARPSDESADAAVDPLDVRTASGEDENAAEWAARPQIGAALGRYVVIEELGRGGMGLVLRAYDPKLQREVALKRVHAELTDTSSQARLVREARAMARLGHPNVVAVYDVEVDLVGGAGVFVVMEYVRGSTLRAWLDAERRPWSEVVAAFVAAGRGLAAAHAQDLLHRDFKADNVLVSDGRVRVTDFGLARSVGSHRSIDGARDDDGEAPAQEEGGVAIEVTEAGLVMGTPPYMAPEQLDGKEVDARVDQYAFCVALWRALAGRFPFEGSGAALARAKSMDPPRWPAEVTVPRYVVGALRRGLAPEPAARWPSMDALLAEIGRDPTRHRRRQVALASLVLAPLCVWGWQGVRRAHALAACDDEAEQIGEVWNAARADAIAAGFDAIASPYATDTWIRAHARLQDYAEKWRQLRVEACSAVELDGRLPPELGPAARACFDEHRDALAALLVQLEQPDTVVVQRVATAVASLPLAAACVDPTVLGHRAELPEEATVRDQVGVLRSRLAGARAARATARYDVALERAQAVLSAASELGWQPLVAEANLAVGDARHSLGRYDAAREAYEDAYFVAGAAGRDEIAMAASSALVLTVGVYLAQHDQGLRWGRTAQMLADRSDRADDPRVSDLLNNLAGVHFMMASYDEARALLERALAIREKLLGVDHPDVASALDNLANVERAMGELDAAEVLHERSLAISEKVLGSNHPDLAKALNNLAGVVLAKGAHAEAKSLYERALALREQTVGPDHPELAASLSNLAAVHIATHDWALAQATEERALAIREKTLGADHPDVAVSAANLAIIHESQGAHAEATAAYERALAIREKALGADHPDVAVSLNNLANARHVAGDDVAARALHERALAIWEKANGPEHASVARSLHNIALLDEAAGAHAEARSRHERALAIREKTLGPDHPEVAGSLAGLANLRLAAGELAEARALFERSLAILEKRFGADHPDVAAAIVGLGGVAVAQGRWVDAAALYERALAIREREPSSARDLAQTRFALAKALWESELDRARALELAERATHGMRNATGAAPAQLAEAEAWLARHRGR